MKIQQISQNNCNFNGSVKVLGKISATQKHLLNLHINNLADMIKEKTYDLFIKQSNSKKTIMLSTDKNFKGAYFIVKKNKQNFEQVTNFLIQDKDEFLKEELEAKKIMFSEYVKSKNNFLYNPFML